MSGGSIASNAPAAAPVAARNPLLDGAAPAIWILALLLLTLPLYTGSFIVQQIFGRVMILGMIALSLMFLAGYGGIVSLVQMTVAGCAGYMVAVLGDSAITTVSLGWPWWAAVPVAIAIATLFGTISGALSVRTEGIYTIMITLAIASAFFYFTLQNYTIFNGFTGFNAVAAPVFLGVDWARPVPLYYLSLVCAALALSGVFYVSRAPFGLSLQGIRDNPRRMAAMGYNVTAHRIAAYAFASVIAAVAGVLLVWSQAQISPGTAGIGPVIDILVMAVVGGLGHPIGPFIGALIYVLLQTFALDVLVAIGIEGRRFQTLIGIGFLAIVLFSPDGVIGLWRRAQLRWREREAERRAAQGGAP